METALVQLSLPVVLLLMLGATLTSVLSTVTGMAGGILLFALMNLFTPLAVTIPLHGVVQFCTNSSRVWLLRSYLLRTMCLYFAIGCLSGVIAATWLLSRTTLETLPLVLLAMLIFYTVFKPDRLPELRLPNWGYLPLGVVTGALGILAGPVDPLLAAFFVRSDLSREQIVVNKSAMQAWVHLLKIPAYLMLGFVFLDYWAPLTALVLAAVFGSYTGVHMLRKMNEQWFMLLLKAALLLAGLRILYQLSNL